MINSIHNLFLDSGAHGLYNQHVVKNKNKYDWYSSFAFEEYVDKYVSFVKENKNKISVYPNIDVIFRPELTWKIQLLLEKKGINPIPVVHYGTDIKWLKRYMARGYDYIALGGLGQTVNVRNYPNWADEIFKEICDQPSHLPKIKTHGFAMTSHKLMTRYPWYSVDSKSWISFGAYGFVVIPARTNGKWDYTKPFFTVRTSIRPCKASSPFKAEAKKETHVQKLFKQYIEEKGYELGESILDENRNEVIIKPGLINDDKERCTLNGIYFIDLAEHLPEWPWPFFTKTKKLSL